MDVRSGISLFCIDGDKLSWNPIPEFPNLQQSPPLWDKQMQMISTNRTYWKLAHLLLWRKKQMVSDFNYLGQILFIRVVVRQGRLTY